MRLTKFNPETGLYEYVEKAKTLDEYRAQRKAAIQKLGAYENTNEVDKLKVMIHLLEQDIADRDKMLESKVEEVYADFMRDYKCMREELEDKATEGRADTIEKIKLMFAMHFGTYTDGDMTPIKEVFSLLDKFEKEMLEDEQGGMPL